MSQDVLVHSSVGLAMTTDGSTDTTETTVVLPKTETTNGTFPIPFPPPSSVNPLDPVPKFLRLVQGIDKLRRAIGKELVSSTSNEKCSNLPHLLSIAQILLRSGHTVPTSLNIGIGIGSGDFVPPVPSAVLKPFHYVPKKSKTQKKIRFIVDIVSKDETEWSKISARNPRSLALLAAGGGGYGQKSMVEHAKEYIQCAQQHQRFFKPPRIKFIFASGIGTTLARKLEVLGIIVEGERIPDDELAIHPRLKPYRDLLYESDTSSNTSKSTEQSGEDTVDSHAHMNGNSPKASSTDKDQGDHDVPPVVPDVTSLLRNPQLEGITKLNLDISTLLAYCSNLTNGHSHATFKSQILTDQSQRERDRPQKPILDELFEGRELYCCEMAFRDFKQILETVGGLQEQRRADELLRRVKVVPDQISERCRSLAIVGSIKLRSVTIFGTGDSIKAVTVSSNSGFVRSAKAQGIYFPVFLHESRALTEDKENFGSFFPPLNLKS